MSPRAFREQSAGDQVEMMGHRREQMLRKAHTDHVSEQVAKEFAERDPKNQGKGKRP